MKPTFDHPALFTRLGLLVLVGGVAACQGSTESSPYEPGALEAPRPDRVQELIATARAAEALAWEAGAPQLPEAEPDPEACRNFEISEEKEELFPVPQALASSVDFWVKIFSEYNSGQYVVHDERYPGVVYKVVGAGHGRDPAVKRTKRQVERALNKLDRKRPKSAKRLRGLEREVFRAWSHVRSSKRFRDARGHVRAQKGQSDRFELALLESGRYRDDIEVVLSNQDLPPELLAIPFIESMFQLGVRSHAGALGVWQFMPDTGREYLNINNVVDERRDPIVATQAAASYLKSAHARLGSWPLAVTSYNYGMNGMARAVNKVGTNDLGKILRRYRSARVGFAVKNYYAEFLAAMHVIDHSRDCFPTLKPKPLWRYEVVELPAPVKAPQLIEAEALNQEVLAEYNPALTKAALKGQVALPRGMSLRVPAGMGNHFNNALAMMGMKPSPAAKQEKKIHVVKHGDNVTRIAQLHGVSVGAVLAANKLTWESPIYPNMRLEIPAAGSGTTPLAPLTDAPVSN